MAISKRWAGRAFGTNLGNLFVTLDGDDSALTGTLRLLDSEAGITLYAITAKFDGTRLELTGEPQNASPEMPLSKLTATAVLSPKGVLNGDWQTEDGTGGTFVLFPHHGPELSLASMEAASQLYTARHRFGAMEINREQLSSVAEEIQQEFEYGKVVITILAGTEQSMLIDNFKTANLKADRAEIVKIFVQQPEPEGVNRVLSIEFGPDVNLAMVQSSNESWALGMLERLKRDLNRFERTYATNFKKYGIGINQLLLAWVVIIIPSLSDPWKRAVLMCVVLALIYTMGRIHTKYLPLAAIYLSEKRQDTLTRFGPAFGSWMAAIIAAIITGLASKYLGAVLLP